MNKCICYKDYLFELDIDYLKYLEREKCRKSPLIPPF